MNRAHTEKVVALVFDGYTRFDWYPRRPCEVKHADGFYWTEIEKEDDGNTGN